MENSKKMNDFSAGEPQVLRKAEIARILNTVKQAPFNADNSKNSENKSFKKRSLLDIALNSAKDDNSEVAIDKDIDQTQENLQNENTTPENNETPEIINEADSQNNFDEENKKQLIEENNALIEERIKKAEQDAFLKGKEEGLEEGKLLGISEARAQSQEGLDAAISVFRIAAETIDSSDQSNLDVLNDTIQRSVLSIAQESAGFIIDTLPEKFISRINELSKLINENIKKISLDMNSEDYAIIKEFIEKDEFLSSLNIKQNKDLLRGNMRLNADGIKVDDFVSYNTSDLFLNDQPKTNDITGNTAEDQNPVENAIAKEDSIQENASQDQQPVDLEALKNENETENSAQDTQSTESNPLETDNIQENASQDQQPVDLEALKNENETENSAQDTQSTESNPLEASDITNENLNKENE